MKLGGGGREQWLMVLPLVGLFVFVTMLLGGPHDALTALEHTVYSAWDRAAMFLRR